MQIRLIRGCTTGRDLVQKTSQATPASRSDGVERIAYARPDSLQVQQQTHSPGAIRGGHTRVGCVGDKCIQARRDTGRGVEVASWSPLTRAGLDGFER